jgi:cofilin
VYDVEFDKDGGKRNKITFISWVPDDAGQYVSATLDIATNVGQNTPLTDLIQPRMMYSTSKEALKRSLNGLAIDIQANDADDIEWDSLVKRASTGR